MPPLLGARHDVVGGTVSPLSRSLQKRMHKREFRSQSRRPLSRHLTGKDLVKRVPAMPQRHQHVRVDEGIAAE